MITMKNMYKSYEVAGEELPVLKNIHLTVEQGEFVAIMGPSGSGKSTLMNVIGCLDKPTSGEYYLNGTKVSDYDEASLAKVRNREIGFVFQQFQLLPRLTAIQNVELPMIYAGVEKQTRLERAEGALEKVGLADRLHYIPNSLSGGQKQRVAIARAIVNEPSILLADEPTGALDSKTGEQIMDMFSLLNEEGTTILVVTHEAEIASYANRTVFVRDGKLTSVDDVLDQQVLQQLVTGQDHSSGGTRDEITVQTSKSSGHTGLEKKLDDKGDDV